MNYIWLKITQTAVHLRGEAESGATAYLSLRKINLKKTYYTMEPGHIQSINLVYIEIKSQ